MREVELEMIMSIKTAKAVRDWLNDRIAMAEALRADASNSLQENGELPDIVLVPEKKEAS